MLNKLLAAMSLVLATVAFASTAEARRCDGVHGCTCGVRQAQYFGLPYVYNGVNLKQAVGWKRAFPRVASAAPGLVVYQQGGGPTGHVARIVSVIDRCTAIVADEKGQYERDICERGAVYVDPNGNAATASFAQSPPTTFHARSKKQRRQPVASYSNYPDLREAH